MEKYTNEHDKTCYKGVELDSPFSVELFYLVEDSFESDIQHAFHSNLGSLTVLDRMTGFGWRDTETGYRDLEGRFWLATGNYDVRYSGCTNVGEAIEWVKQRANTCIPS